METKAIETSTQVQNQLLALDEALGFREKLLEELENKLTSVLREFEPDDTVKSAEIDISLVPLATTLRALARALRRNNKRLQSMTERLEL